MTLMLCMCSVIATWICSNASTLYCRVCACVSFTTLTLKFSPQVHRWHFRLCTTLFFQIKTHIPDEACYQCRQFSDSVTRKFCRTSLGVDSNPLTTSRFHFLAKPVYLCTTIRRLPIWQPPCPL